MRRIVVLGAIAVLTVVLPSSVRAAEPLRSGTIVGGTGETPVNPWVRGMEGCVGAPTCSAWLQSGCAPALAGVDPAIQASIVDVADLADGVTPRFLQFRADPTGITLGGVLIQFWTGPGDGLGGYPWNFSPAG